ncbi:MAG TPA: ATP-binding cassette domain-containing protein [Woeseiaceae bacterium]
MGSDVLLEAASVIKLFAKPRRGLVRRATGSIRAVDGVSLAIAEGQSVGLVGESGCGKSTLARLMLLLMAPTHGEIRYRGTPASALTRRQLAEFRREVQPVFQDPFQSLNPKMTVGRIVSEPLRALGGISRAEIRSRTGDALERAELRAADANRMPVDFSGGQRQRIAIARALVSRPRLIVLDEPVSSQDVSIRAQILNLLKSIRREDKVACLFISHDLSTVRFLCEVVHVMNSGKIVESGAPRDLFASPAHPYTATLLSAWLPPDPERARHRLRPPGPAGAR